MSAPKLKLIAADFFERPVKLRLPFRGGAIALRSLDAPGLGVGLLPDFNGMTASP